MELFPGKGGIIKMEKQTFNLKYPAKFEKDDEGRVLVSFRDFPEAHTDGKDYREALDNSKDLLNSVISLRLEYQETLPNPSKILKGEQYISSDSILDIYNASLKT